MGLLDDPYKMNLALSGLGLLTSDYEDQSNRYKDMASQGLLQQAQHKAGAKDRELDRALKQAQIDSMKNPVEDIPTAQQNYNLARQQGYQGTFLDYQRDLKNAGRTSIINTVGTGFPYKIPENTMPVDVTDPSLGVTPIPGTSSKGETEVDKKFAPEYVDWTTKGFSDAQKGVEQLKLALGDLTSGKTKTGGVEAGLNTVLPDSLMGFVAPDFVNTKDQVEEVVQRNLRLILGAQFTEKEGARLIARAYNPTLKPEQNIERVRRLVKQIEDAANAKQAAAIYWQENGGTLKGFKGKIFAAGDFDPDALFGSDLDELQQLEQELGL